jgi:signal transduction histidine kinase
MSESFYKHISDNALVGLVAFELPAFKFTYMNTMASEILEVDLSSLSGFKIENMITETAKPPFRRLSKEILELEGLVEDIMLKKSNGQHFVASVGIKKIEAPDKTYLMLMFQDVTFQKKLMREVALKQEELKKTYEELLEQNEALKALDKAKDKFMALVTHELRTPLSAIIATAEVLHMKLYDDEKQLHEFIATINTEGQHLMVIVNDILDFSKIRAGQMEFYIEETNPVPLMSNHKEGFEQMATGNGLTLELKVPPEVRCYFDPLRLNQVVANVVSNAIKFSRKGGTVTLSVEDRADTVVLAVKDQGAGIPAKFASKVFNEFETIENVKTHHKGTGLGMPISKKLMEGMGGKIWFESEEGVGTTFFLELPKKKVCAPELYRHRPTMEGDLAA